MRSHRWERRAITAFLLTLLAVIMLEARDSMTSVVLLSAPVALLSRIVAFYFPRARSNANARKKPANGGDSVT
jgi:hypothetical protein